MLDSVDIIIEVARTGLERTLSPFSKNDVLYSVGLSSDIIQAFMLFTEVTSIEFERDLPPGIQLRRIRPRVGLGLAG